MGSKGSAVSDGETDEHTTGLTLVEVGPVSLTVRGERNGRLAPVDIECVRAHISEVLAQLRDCLPVLKQKARRIKNPAYLPDVAKMMIDAVKRVDEMSLTPMAAVAGSVADAVGERLAKDGFDFLIVNNGGDIAVFNPSGRDVRIAVGDVEKDVAVRYVLAVRGVTRFGIATSGFGGRSFTLGLADMVTVIADSAAVADAAATYVCNQTYVESDRVTRQAAREIDPETDIPDELVTVTRGDLPRNVVFEALRRGLDSAEHLKMNGVVRDAVLVLGREMATTIRGGPTIDLEVAYGD
jgi:uncharacterized protein